MFKYKKLDLKGSGFRLVRLQKGDGKVIECELIYTTLDDNVIPYEAVSYTWGTLERQEHIHISGDILPVTSNLWHILHDLRSPNVDRYLWVDAICINQDDNLERGHQVQQMRRIYRSADRGIFYLSPHTVITQVIMESLTVLQKQVTGSRWAANDGRWVTAWQEVYTRLRRKYDDLESRQTEGLAYLLLSPFFRRVWILQEVASVRRASVFCGTSSIPAHIFAIVTRIEKAITNSHVSAVIDLMLKSLDTTINSLQEKSLASLLKQFSESEASDERDRIYALLGLCARKRAKALIPDYTLSIPDMIEHTLIHIYGPYITRSPRVSTVDELVNYLRKPASEMVHELLGLNPLYRYNREAFFSYIDSVEVPIKISDELTMSALRYMIHRWPAEGHDIFNLLEIRSITLFHEMVSLAIESKRYAEILRFMCQHGYKVVVDAQVSFILNTRHTKLLKILIEPCMAKVVIHVSMRALSVILLLVSDEDIEALIPLLDGVDSPTKAALTRLYAAASQLAGSFRSRDAVMLLWKLTGDTKSGQNNDTTPIKGNGHLGSRRRLSLNSDQMTGGDEGTAELESWPINIDSQLDPPPSRKWQPDVSKSNSYGGSRSNLGRSQSI
ncbi:heterokaryon incompatibility protein-domain-containing protein [Xylaria acuta]|nr:heterokaryon incompatibility protein-domain-containing protein [Xylaria acuta]